jgi:endonuclease-3
MRSHRHENKLTAAQRRRGECVAAILPELKRLYPDAKCSLDYTSPLELLVATILSAQCTDARVNIVTKTLFKAYRSAADYAAASQEELEKHIASTGFYRNKAKAIRSMAADLVKEHGGQVPRTMEELTALAGVGRKTANVVLGNAFGINAGITVDTHVTRLCNRLGLTKTDDAVKIEQDLIPLVPQEDWTLFSHLLICHGRAVCPARAPKCTECTLAPHCPSAGKTT